MRKQKQQSSSTPAEQGILASVRNEEGERLASELLWRFKQQPREALVRAAAFFVAHGKMAEETEQAFLAKLTLVKQVSRMGGTWELKEVR